MNAATLNLNVREALEGSLLFLGDFLKKHWLLSIIYVGIAVLPAFIIGDQHVTDLALDKSVQLGIVMIVNIFPGLLMVYYSLKDSLLKLDPAIQVSNKSLAASLWQIFLVKIISAFIGVPLFILLLAPGIWWSTKATVSYAHLLSTEDGPIASIKKSHQLMNGRFWSCFGFLLTTSSAVIFVVMIAAVTIGFFLALGGVLNAIFHDGAGFNKLTMIFRLIGPVFAVFYVVIFYYLQAWLYVYLRSQEKAGVITT